MADPRREIGSLFDLARWSPGGERGRCPWEEHEHRLAGTGRDALALALAGGGFRRLWLPSYLCREVAAAAAVSGVDVAFYPDSPLEREPAVAGLAVGAADAVLVVNYFGLRRWAGAGELAARGAAVIEDHTHAPCSAWALASTADYAIASLRKLLPLADGGVVWSPRGRRLPGEPGVSEAHARAAARKLEGMVAKRLYLDGHAVEKEWFRARLAEGEAALFAGPPSGMTALSRAMLAAFPLAAWDRQRTASFDAFAAALPPVAGLTLHRPAHRGDVPFSALLELDTAERRDRALRRMCEQGVYPSTLWPLDGAGDGIPSAHRALARRLLSLPLDMRYAPEDLVRAAGVVAGSAA